MKTVRLRKLTPMEAGVLSSLLLHLFIWAAFSWKARVDIADGDVDPMEIDLTRPFRITSDPSLARRAEKSGTGAPVVDKPTPKAGLTEEKPKPPQDWTLPTPRTTELLKPTEDAPPVVKGSADGEGAGLGGLGDGTDDGEVDWVYLTDVPRLLNKERVKKDMLRFYPMEERSAGREGHVVLDVHINGEGRVVRVTVVESGGALFDEAARKVMSRARFSPAKIKGRAVPVKVPKDLTFSLGD